MTSTAPTSISSLPRGHALAPASFSVDEALVSAYLVAIGDDNDYGSTVPPLAAIALGLEALQNEIGLPEGSLHTGQEIEHNAPLAIGDKLTLTGRIAQRSERQGYVISVIEFEIAGQAGIALRARSTIMAPAAVGAS